MVGPLHSTAIHSMGGGGGGNLFSSFEYSIDASTFSNVKASIIQDIISVEFDYSFITWF